MYLTNKTIWDSIQALGSVNEKGKLGYACAHNLRKLMDAGKEFMEVRDRMLQVYGTDDGNGKFEFTPDGAKAFREAIREYEEIEHEVDVYRIPEEVFTSGDLTSKHMYVLEWMVKADD